MAAALDDVQMLNRTLFWTGFIADDDDEDAARERKRRRRKKRKQRERGSHP
jgi:hypothetical protein